MAFDYGLSQIGIAIGNCVLGTTQPLTVLQAKNGQPSWQVLEDLIKEWRPDVLVVGEPFNMDGTTSELSERANKFGRRLHGRLGLEVAMVDERLSSFEAKQNSRDQGHRGNYKRHPVDSLAAELVLQTWLSENGKR